MNSVKDIHILEQIIAKKYNFICMSARCVTCPLNVNNELTCVNGGAIEAAKRILFQEKINLINQSI